MNKQELASKIWAGANALRGKVSAGKYKDYMLGLIFYKYLSEKEEKYLKEQLFFEEDDFKTLTEDDADTVENCVNNLGYFIENKNLFSYWINNGNDFTIKNVRDALSAFKRITEPNKRSIYKDIFNTLDTGLNDLGSGDPERTKALKQLLKLIVQIPVDGNQRYDVLGFVYEFLLKNFAANAGKAGEFYTPYEASVIMSEIISYHLKDRDTIKIYDPTSGSGSLLINIGKSVAKHMDKPNSVKYYAQELIPDTYNLTRMNLIMRDILPDNIIVRNGDTLADDWPFFDDSDKEKTYYPLFVDGCCSNPPYSQAWDTNDAEMDARFSDYGVAPKSKADYAFLLHNLYHLKPDGIMTIVLPHGVLFRGNPLDKGEGTIRSKLIDKHQIEAIIGLPANMFFGTGIPTIIMVLKKQRDESDVLFVDASKGFVKDGNKNRLRAKDVRKIVDTVLNKKTISGYSRLVEKSEIVKNNYNLNISRYVVSDEPPETWDLYATMFGGIPNSELDKMDALWNTFPSLRGELFKNDCTPYSTVKTQSVAETIHKNTQVKNYIEKYQKTLEDLPNYLTKSLIDDYKNVAIAREEQIIASEIKRRIEGIPLIDYYDAYQALDDNWNTIALDLELLQQEEFDAVKVVEPHMVYKKNKDKELEEFQDGYQGRIIPFELIQNYYYSEIINKLDNLISELADAQDEKENLLNSIDPNDKAEIVNDNGEVVSKKLNKVIARLKKEKKKGAEFEEGSYEDIMMKINDNKSHISKVNKLVKSIRNELEDAAGQKIKELSDEEAVVLLRLKWIEPLMISLRQLSNESINNYVQKIEKLKKKYQITMSDLASDIEESERSISELMDALTGSEYDMKGIKQFKKLLEGDLNDN